MLKESRFVFFFQAEDGIRDGTVTGVQTCALPIFDLHARVRGPSAALRLVPRRPRHLPSAADRVRAPQPVAHRDVEAEAAAARGGRLRERLGRSTHANAGRPAPSRLYA